MYKYPRKPYLRKRPEKSNRLSDASKLTQHISPHKAPAHNTARGIPYTQAPRNPITRLLEEQLTSSRSPSKPRTPAQPPPAPYAACAHLRALLSARGPAARKKPTPRERYTCEARARRRRRHSGPPGAFFPRRRRRGDRRGENPSGASCPPGATGPRAEKVPLRFYEPRAHV